MKQINHDTDRLIILNYPVGAGGKFISLCMALSPRVVHQDKKLARQKMKGDMDDEESFNISMSVLSQSKKYVYHRELGCRDLSGFNLSNSRNEQLSLANNLWRELTNQREFYFFLVAHEIDQGLDYRNAYHIIFKNYDYIIEQRKIENSEIEFEQHRKKDRIIYFDQGSIKDSDLFKKEIGHLYRFFSLEEPNWDHIEQLRSMWLDTFKIGF